MSWRVGVWAALFAGSLLAADDAPLPSPASKPDFRDRAFARELQRMWTIEPEQLVTVIGDAARRDPASPSLALLLAIAHAETSGDVLDISEAGAVGLAQATPIALRQEGIGGKLYVTRDYLEGARDYILKKPLHDIEVIADAASFDDAKVLLASATVLRREGVDDLELLSDWADRSFFAGVRADDARNLEMLTEMAQAIDARDLAAMQCLHDRAHDEYRASLARQQAAWKRYQVDLIARRDAFLEQHFRTKRRKKLGYAAGEMLAAELDVRFSPSKMAEFLVRHLERKAMQANTLAASPDKREEMTAALYNGGTHNVKRMIAGLITTLPETENYMRKVPAMRKRLDGAVIASIEPSPGPYYDGLIPPFR